MSTSRSDHFAVTVRWNDDQSPDLSLSRVTFRPVRSKVNDVATANTAEGWNSIPVEREGEITAVLNGQANAEAKKALEARIAWVDSVHRQAS